MRRFALIAVLFGLQGVLGCGEAGGAVSGESLYLERHTDGNTFACATCHALEEPAPDGIRRPGHPIGDAANRPSFKNGQLDELLDAVNSCRVEWMAAPAFAPDDARWAALFDYLSEAAGEDEAAALTYEIVVPPSNLDGGDAMVGQSLFNASCVACHGVDATGTELAPALRGSLLDAQTVATRTRTSGDANSAVYEGLTGGRMPFWAADRLSDNELVDVIAFVLGNEPGTGGTGGAGGTGGTGGIAPLAKRRTQRSVRSPSWQRSRTRSQAPRSSSTIAPYASMISCSTEAASTCVSTAASGVTTGAASP